MVCPSDAADINRAARLTASPRHTKVLRSACPHEPGNLLLAERLGYVFEIPDLQISRNFVEQIVKAVGANGGWLYFFEAPSGKYIRRLNKTGDKIETIEFRAWVPTSAAGRKFWLQAAERSRPDLSACRLSQPTSVIFAAD